MTAFQDKVYKLTSSIPRGRVSTYKEIARAMHSKAYRAVGSALRVNPHAPRVPCHRVVNSDGSVGSYAGKPHSRKKMEMLRREGVRIETGRVIALREFLVKLA